MIKQNIVFIENKAGSLQKVTGLLKEAGIDIYGFACFDAPENDSKWYPEKDYHTMYIAEVLKVFVRE